MNITTWGNFRGNGDSDADGDAQGKKLRVNRIWKSNSDEMWSLAYQFQSSQQTSMQLSKHQTKQYTRLYCPFVLFCSALALGAVCLRCNKLKRWFPPTPVPP